MSGAGVGAAWSRPFLSGAGAGVDPIGSEPESAPEPWASRAEAGAGAAQKSGGSATLVNRYTASVSDPVPEPDPGA